MPLYTKQHDPWEDLPSQDTPINGAALGGMEEGIRRASIVIVTALPVSPVHGDEVYYEVESGLLWHLVYDSTVVDAYKWVADGAQPLRHAVATLEAISAASFVNLATAGPLVDAPLAGLYYAIGKAEMRTANAAAIYTGFLGVGLNDFASGNEADSSAATAVQASAARVSVSVMAEIEAAAGDDVKLRYGVSSANLMSASQRSLAAWPLRVG